MQVGRVAEVVDEQAATLAGMIVARLQHVVVDDELAALGGQGVSGSGGFRTAPGVTSVATERSGGS